MFKIGPYQLENPFVLAPMAGVTDKPFRNICRNYGAALAISEMTSANSTLWKSEKTLKRLDHVGEAAPVSVQIAGADPLAMAKAAQFNVEHGAQIIDINMGCPAKKVCKVNAGSALMQDEKLVAEILKSVVKSVNVPVTLKIRTGWDRQNKNALNIAQIAEQAGIQALAIHGRTRADKYMGDAEYQTIKQVKKSVSIPVLANGDITSAEKALRVLEETQVDGIMIGRAALGNPWIFEQCNDLLKEKPIEYPNDEQKKQQIEQHLSSLYEFYGEYKGIRIGRKHISWYCKNKKDSARFRAEVNQIDLKEQQLESIRQFFS